MRIIDLFSMAMRNMFKRKLRTFLTVMGVVVGSAAITIMISLGVAVNMALDDMVEEMGQRAVRISVRGPWSPGPFDTVLSSQTLAAIRAMPNVEIVTPVVDSSLTFVSGRYTAWLSITGIEPEAMPALGLNVDQGRGLLPGDEFQIVYAANALSQFRNERNMNMWWGMEGLPDPDIDLLLNPLRASFDQNALTGGGGVRPYLIEGVGIMARDDEDWDFSWSSFMHIDQVVEIERERHRWQQQAGGGGGTMFFTSGGGGGMFFGGGGGSTDFPLDSAFPRAFVIVNDVSNVEEVATAIRELGFDEWSVMTNTWAISFHQESSAALQNLLAAVGAVSLFISAIGIANTMIMAIYERTKEIGVMKVIGASVKDVRRLFLLEAAIIGAFGGAIGLALSMGASYLLNNTEMALFTIQQWGEGDVLISYIPMWLLGLSFGFSCVVGLVSGFLPARRATKISALAAIRTE